MCLSSFPLFTGASLAVSTPAFALPGPASQICSDSSPHDMKETPIVSGPPLSLSFELGWDGNILEHAALCYELTDPSGTTELAGGTLEEWSGGTGSGAGLAVANLNDPSAALHTDVLVGALGEDGGYIYVAKASAPATGYTVTWS